MERFDKKRKKSRFDLRDIVTKYEKGIAVNNTILGLGVCFLSQPVTKPTTMIDDQQVDTVKEVKLLGLVKWSDLKWNTYIDATVNLRLGTLAISAVRATRKGQTIGLYNTCRWECAWFTTWLVVAGEYRCAMTTSVTSKMRTQPELAGTGATTHRVGNARK